MHAHPRPVFHACAFLLLVICVGSQETKKRKPGAELAECLNSGSQASHQHQPATYSDFFHGVPARLSLESAWWSTKSVYTSELTIVTAANRARLRQLEAQCNAWNGPLVAAVYVGLLSDKEPPVGHANRSVARLHRVKAQLADLHSRLEAHENSCALDILLLTEALSDAVMKWLFPVNVLRNYAAMAARTDLLLMLDVDFLPSVSLQQWLAVPENAQQLQHDCAQGQLYVLPAFEVDRQLSLDASHAAAIDAIARDKQGLLQLVTDQTVLPFALRSWYMAQYATMYAHWFTSSKAYQVNITWDYEPWVIADRRMYPFFDSIYRAYVYEKTIQSLSAHYRGFKFIVHPEGFLVHRNHPPTKVSLFHAKHLMDIDRMAYDKLIKEGTPHAKANQPSYLVLQNHYELAMQQMANGTYRPVLDEGVVHCLNTLSWWRGDYAHNDSAVGPTSSAMLPKSPQHTYYHSWKLPQV